MWRTRRAMATVGQIPSWIGARLSSSDGTPIGTIVDLLHDTVTHEPAWLVVDLSDCLAIVPTGEVRSVANDVSVPYLPETVRRGRIAGAAAGCLARADAIRLCRHYGVRPSSGTWAGTVAAQPVAA